MSVLPVRKESLDNSYYRRVAYSTDTQELVFMCLMPGEDIPAEVHRVETQNIRVESGTGKVKTTKVENSSPVETEFPIEEGKMIVVMPGTNHYVQQTGDAPLKLTVIYSFPPGKFPHANGLIHARQKDVPPGY